MARQFKAIAFDLDGTLIDTEPFYRQLMAKALKQKLNYNLTEEEYDKYYLGLTTTHGMINILKMIWGREPSATELEDMLNTVREISANLKEGLTFLLFPQVEEILKWCREHHIPTAIVTNAKRTTIERYASQYQWDTLLPKVDYLVTTLDVNEPKPHPALYLKAAEMLGIPPKELLAVEDTDQGVQSAKASGASVVRVNSAGRGDADYYFKTIGEMIDRLPEFFAQK